LKEKEVGSGIKSLTEKSSYKASVRSRDRVGGDVPQQRDVIEDPMWGWIATDALPE